MSRWNVYAAEGRYLCGRLLGTVAGCDADGATPGPTAARAALALFRGRVRVAPGWLGAAVVAEDGTPVGSIDLARDVDAVTVAPPPETDAQISMFGLTMAAP